MPLLYHMLGGISTDFLLTRVCPYDILTLTLDKFYMLDKFYILQLRKEADNVKYRYYSYPVYVNKFEYLRCDSSSVRKDFLLAVN